ncbi:hypothetical protein [Kaistella jeonii]|uniref:hypothetical protein n=1 Tax=Kaistella jeonii TaxID=266749 RepID=UPI0008EC1CD1|nr:hypothetical protein [Kaistella jeonii]SFC36889.1 hypothetical protein SAMN05421876_11640 [Kaistella jeonii]VEI97279.1 Uncharacterised protein [Kaistella jeonii]
MNWLILLIFGIFAIALVVFLIIRNQKDEKKYETEVDNDYSKPLSENKDIDMMK